MAELTGFTEVESETTNELSGFTEATPSNARPNAVQEMEALEAEGLSVRPQVPMAGEVSTPSGHPVDRSLRDVAIDQKVQDLRADKQALEALRVLRAEGRDYPLPREDMYKGLSMEEAVDVYNMYMEGRDDAMPGATPTYMGTLIPAPTADPVSRRGQQLVRGLGQAGYELLNTGLSTVDTSINTVMGGLSGERPSDMGGWVRENQPRLPSGGMVDKAFQEVGREIPAMLTGAKLAGGRGASIPRQVGAGTAATAVSAASSDTDDIGQTGAAALLGVVDAISPETADRLAKGEELSERELLNKAGAFIELGILQGIATGVFKAGGLLASVGKDAVIDPVAVFMSESKAANYVVEMIRRDFAPSLANLNEAQKTKVNQALMRSLRKEDDVPATTLTRISEDFRLLAEQEKDSAVADAYQNISRSAAGIEKGSQLNRLVNTRQGELDRAQFPGQDTSRISGDLGTSSTVVPKQARITQDATQRDMVQKAGQRAQTYRNVGAAADAVEDRVLDEVNKKYTSVRNKVGNILASDDMIGEIKGAGVPLPDDATYGDLLDSIRPLNRKIKQLIGANKSDEAQALMDIKDRIYTDEIDSIIKPDQGVDMTPIKEELRAAREFYRDEYADVYMNDTPTMSRGATALSATRGFKKEPGRGSVSARAESTRKTLIDTFDPETDPGAREDLDYMFGKYGQTSDQKALAKAKKAEDLFNDQSEEAKLLYNAVEPFTSGRGQPSTDALSTQFDNLFKGGTKDTSVLLRNMKQKLSEPQYNRAVKGLQQGALDWINRTLNDSTGLSEKAYTKSMANAFATLKAIPSSPEEKVIYEGLEELYNRVGSQAEFSAKQTGRLTNLSDILGSEIPQDAQGALNKAATFAFGVLNSLATKVRQGISAGVRSKKPERLEVVREITDNLLSDPKAFADQIEKFSEVMDKREAREAFYNDFFYRLLPRPGARTINSELEEMEGYDYRSELQGILDEIEAEAVFEEMEYSSNGPDTSKSRSYRDPISGKMTTDIMKK